MDFEALDFVTGIFTTLLAGVLLVLTQCRRNLRNFLRLRQQASTARHMQLEPLTVSPDWIQSGSPVFKMCEYAESADRRSSSGIWSCEGPATFEWHYDIDEGVFVLDGRVEVEYLGQRIVLEPGGSARFYAGTKALWYVPQYVRKSYMIHSPNILVRGVRRLLRVI